MKERVGCLAAAWVQENSIVGIGTGSTVRYFIEHLSQRCHQGLKIQVVCSSARSYEFAKAQGIPIIESDKITSVDLTVDGADEIDRNYRMIKGGGGALLREKILAYASKKMTVIIDETKLVDQLGKQKLPLELLPFAFPLTIKHINQQGFHGKIRKTKEGAIYYTDNGNMIYDISFNSFSFSPEKENKRLIEIPGVVETGFFFNAATDLLVGHQDGRVEHIKIEKRS